ncbi:T9SS-dependent choice-of-anchor J family protein [Snuella lapsa]|uniref:Secretion system C-terminal sorting domain-containing protein n=1 Tax=Snuella lapsa TaxID=870481 RepID=A0ABP6YJ17_9FLAO
MRFLITLSLVLLLKLDSIGQNSCAGSQTIGPGTTSVGTINGTAATLICDSKTAGTKAEWFAYTATTDGYANITTDLPVNSGLDTNMYIYSGTCGSLTCLASNDDITPANVSSKADFPIASGTTYYIVFDNRWSSSGFDFQITENTVSCSVTSPPVQENFSNMDTILACWNLIDSDLDSRKWFVQDFDLDENPGLDGNPCIVSRSWDATSSVNPDNWIISYSIDLSSYSTNDDLYLNWKARGFNSNFPNENYTVYVAEGNNTSDFLSSGVSFNEVIGQNGGAGETFVDRNLDISSLAGKIVYVAFRHHDMPSSQYELHIDDVQISTALLSVEEHDSNSFKQYYKDGYLTLKSDGHSISHLMLYNILGQSVLTKALSNPTEIVDISSLKDGIYISKVQINDTIKTSKFIKY